jgi:hypothetical protein
VVITPILSAFRGRVREFFALRQAERRSAELSPALRQSVRVHCEAAARRLAVADRLRDATEMGVALSLYRQAALFLTHALLLGKDDMVVSAVTPDVVFDRLDRKLRSEQLEAPPGFRRARPLLATEDPLAYDGLSADEASRKLREFAVTARWLSNLIEVRSPTELRLVRVGRQTAAAVCGLVLAVGLGRWIALPGNLALHRLAISSSTAFDTVPAGAVDGTKNGRFGFHSGEEDSPWLSIDLGAPRHIETVKVFGRGDCCFDQSVPLALETSDDGNSFRKLAERTNKFSETDPWVIEPGPFVTRVLRLRTERRSFLVLSEVEVYGERGK